MEFLDTQESGGPVVGSETSPRFALRLVLAPVIESIAGLLPGIITQDRLRSIITSVFTRHTGATEIAKLRELTMFLGPTAEPTAPGKRQLQMRLQGDWNVERLMAEMTANPARGISVEEQNGCRCLKFRQLRDLAGQIEPDGTILITSTDVERNLAGHVETPLLPSDIEPTFQQVPLFVFARRGGRWWESASRWVNTRIAGTRPGLAEELNESGQHACLYLGDRDNLIIEIAQTTDGTAEQLHDRLETLRQTWVDHLAPERLEPGPQNAASPVFAFFTMPLSSAMPVLRIFRHVLQQVNIASTSRLVRLSIPLRVAFAALSSPIALISLIPVVPALIAAASTAAKPAMSGIFEAFREENADDSRRDS